MCVYIERERWIERFSRFLHGSAAVPVLDAFVYIYIDTLQLGNVMITHNGISVQYNITL